MTQFRRAPTDQGDVALPGQPRNPSQFSVCFILEFDLLPQPAAVSLYHLRTRPIAPDPEWISQYAARNARHIAPNINSIAAICLLVFNVNHVFSPFAVLLAATTFAVRT